MLSVACKEAIVVLLRVEIVGGRWAGDRNLVDGSAMGADDTARSLIAGDGGEFGEVIAEPVRVAITRAAVR